MNIFNLNGKNCTAFTQVFLIKNGKILLLKRAKKKKWWPNKWHGIGGHAELNEDVFETAKREFKEETNLSIKDVKLRGIFAWFDENEEVGINHIFLADNFEGDLKLENEDEELEWFDIKELNELEDLAEHVLLFLPKLIQNESFFYNSISKWENYKMIEYCDNLG
jgi:8-oxo-dGTP diphosphatase